MWKDTIQNQPTLYTSKTVTTNYCCAPYLASGICIATSQGLFASSAAKNVPRKLNHNIYCALAVYYNIIIAATHNTVHFIENKTIVHTYNTELYITGIFTGPSGRPSTLVTVWLTPAGESAPRLVTAYPARRT